MPRWSLEELRALYIPLEARETREVRDEFCCNGGGKRSEPPAPTLEYYKFLVVGKAAAKENTRKCAQEILAQSRSGTLSRKAMLSKRQDFFAHTSLLQHLTQELKALLALAPELARQGSVQQSQSASSSSVMTPSSASSSLIHPADDGGQSSGSEDISYSK